VSVAEGFRFIGIAPSVDLTERRSEMLNAQTEPFTVDDIIGYKVFTALLTQSGGDNYINQTSGTFDIGVTYSIDTYKTGDDFSNVGGPASGPNGAWDGYSFIATGTTPLIYTNGSGIDHNTGAPVATVLDNTIGNVWFTYNGVGSYLCYSSNEVNYLKTLVSISQTNTITNLTATNVDDNTSLAVINSTDFTENAVNSRIYNTPIEIRVYN
jgi:hypothetical protein